VSCRSFREKEGPDHRRDAEVASALEVVVELLAQSQVDADESMDRLTNDIEALLDDPVFKDDQGDPGNERDHIHVRARIISEVQFYDLLVQRIQRINSCLEVMRQGLSDGTDLSSELEHRLDETVRFFHESPPPSRIEKPQDVLIFFDDLADG